MKTSLRRICVTFIMLLMFAAGAIPVFAAKEIPITKINFPSKVTIKTGESKTLKLSVSPSNTTYTTEVCWGQQPEGCFTVKTLEQGAVHKKQAAETIKGIKPGRGYLSVSVTVRSSTGKFIKDYLFDTTVNVVSSGKNPTKTPSIYSAPVLTLPLEKIQLNKSAVTMSKGDSTTLSVKFIPECAGGSKTVTWSSSNTSIASVSKGKVTAKKAGTATIKAKVGSKTAVCKITVTKKPKSYFKDLSGAYKTLNQFRTTRSNQWYWDRSNTRKITVYGLKPLKRDAQLEKIAKKRAKEQWSVAYEYHYGLRHERLDGSSCWTAYPASSRPCAENLTWYVKTFKEAVYSKGPGWAETDNGYKHQEHRRNMLSREATRVGIACYVKDGKTLWAMCLGY